MKLMIFSAGDIVTMWLLEKHEAPDSIKELMRRPIRSTKRYAVARKILLALSDDAPKKPTLKKWWYHMTH